MIQHQAPTRGRIALKLMPTFVKQMVFVNLLYLNYLSGCSPTDI